MFCLLNSLQVFVKAEATSILTAAFRSLAPSQKPMLWFFFFSQAQPQAFTKALPESLMEKVCLPHIRLTSSVTDPAFLPPTPDWSSSYRYLYLQPSDLYLEVSLSRPLSRGLVRCLWELGVGLQVAGAGVDAGEMKIWRHFLHSAQYPVILLFWLFPLRLYHSPTPWLWGP